MLAPPHYPDCKEHSLVACIALHQTSLSDFRFEFHKGGCSFYSLAMEMVNQESERLDAKIVENWLCQSTETVILTNNFFGDNVRRTDEAEERAVIIALERASERYDGSFDWIEW